MKHRVSAALLAVCLLVSLLAVPAAAAGGYSDVPQGDWAEEVIQKATDYGLIEGKGDGTFGYGEYMNRASFVTVLCRMFGWKMVTPDKPSFSDCDPGKWYYSAVETALANGAIDSGLYFRPNDDISRQDMAIMLVRALGYENLALAQASAELPFSDVTENRGYIALAYEFGIINGVKQADGSLLFLPGHSSTRQEAAAMLVRVYDKYHADIGFLHGFYAMSSYSQIDMAKEMDAVSLGWARLTLDLLRRQRVGGASGVRAGHRRPEGGGGDLQPGRVRRGERPDRHSQRGQPPGRGGAAGEGRRGLRRPDH